LWVLCTIKEIRAVLDAYTQVSCTGSLERLCVAVCLSKEGECSSVGLYLRLYDSFSVCTLLCNLAPPPLAMWIIVNALCVVFSSGKPRHYSSTQCNSSLAGAVHMQMYGHSANKQLKQAANRTSHTPGLSGFQAQARTPTQVLTQRRLAENSWCVWAGKQRPQHMPAQGGPLQPHERRPPCCAPHALQCSPGAM
jgi:hypothetical protein